ncbi:hypothetical protein RCH22_004092 [Cryobacterium psychrotolerans]|nr:hypothetical protein [Cryobacterium psychrotolerans]
MPLRRTQPGALVSVRFSSVLFTSLPREHEDAWTKKYGLRYPNDSELRRVATSLDTFAAGDGVAFVRFFERCLGVHGSEATHIFYVCPWVGGSISEPGILNPTRSPLLMQMTVLHELAHRLLTLNNAYEIGRSRSGSLSDAWRFRWGTELSFVTLTHVPVFALLDEYVALHPELRAVLDADRDRHAAHPAYARAWEIVEQRGSAEVCLDARECFLGLHIGRG